MHSSIRTWRESLLGTAGKGFSEAEVMPILTPRTVDSIGAAKTFETGNAVVTRPVNASLWNSRRSIVPSSDSIENVPQNAAEYPRVASLFSKCKGVEGIVRSKN